MTTPPDAPKPYVECQYCDGRGILIGPYDPNTSERQIRECAKCDGKGIKIIRGQPAASPQE